MMSPRTRKILGRLGWSALALLVVLAVFTGDLLRHGGQFRALPPPTPLACETIALPGSAEDIQIDRASGLAYLSVLDRRGRMTDRGIEGDILQLDAAALDAPGAPAPAALSALAAKPPGFVPHGLSLHRMGDGKLRMSVISHPPDGGHRIEIFEQRADGLFTPVRSVRDPLFVSPNALVVTGPEQFYVANDSGAANGLQRAAELGLRHGLSTLVHFDGKAARVVAGGLASAVGLGMSPDGRHLYAAETLGKRLVVYRRDAGTAALDRIAEIPVEGAPDNVNVDGRGTVWLGVHGRTLDLVRHFGDAAHPSPTWILRWTPQIPGATPQTVFLDDGRRLSAGSVGAALKGRLLVGSITEPKMLSCRLP
jgi:arylesterase/paraoxonase